MERAGHFVLSGAGSYGNGRMGDHAHHGTGAFKAGPRRRGAGRTSGRSCYEMKIKSIKIIGAGLAGSEAAWQCARRGVAVELYEMRPGKSTPAHRTDKFAELVCSNSLKSESENTAPWLLKEEMR